MSLEVRELTKVFRVPVKDPGLVGSLKSLFNRQYREVRAVDRVSFAIEPGERVGFLGPNGAGKTTTLKMLTGLLYPTAGSIEVLGHRPQDRHPDFLRSVTLVMGQKQQLLWDLPPADTFLLNRAVFDIPADRYAATLAELTELLGLGEFDDQPVRNLSLGQRMRAELAAALLHRPQVLFLDEPTIGLDVEVQAQVRRFVDTYCARTGATLMLTSHDMEDVSRLAERILLIDHGVVRFDGSIDELQRRFGLGRRVSVGVANPSERDRHVLGTVLGMEEQRSGLYVATVPPEQVNALLGRILAEIPGAELAVGEPPLREVLTAAFGAARVGRESA